MPFPWDDALVKSIIPLSRYTHGKGEVVWQQRGMLLFRVCLSSVGAHLFYFVEKIPVTQIGVRTKV